MEPQYIVTFILCVLCIGNIIFNIYAFTIKTNDAECYPPKQLSTLRAFIIIQLIITLIFIILIATYKKIKFKPTLVLTVLYIIINIYGFIVLIINVTKYDNNGCSSENRDTSTLNNATLAYLIINCLIFSSITLLMIYNLATPNEDENNNSSKNPPKLQLNNNNRINKYKKSLNNIKLNILLTQYP